MLFSHGIFSLFVSMQISRWCLSEVAVLVTIHYKEGRALLLSRKTAPMSMKWHNERLQISTAG